VVNIKKIKVYKMRQLQEWYIEQITKKMAGKFSSHWFQKILKV